MKTEGNGAVRRLSELNAPVADGHADTRGWEVHTADGTLAGTVEDLLVDPGAMAVHFILVQVVKELAPNESMRTLRVPIGHADLDVKRRRVNLKTLSSKDLGLLPVDRAGVGAAGERSQGAAHPGGEDVRVVLSHEELDVNTRWVEAGEVGIAKRVETEQVRKLVPVEREDVSIERRPVPADITDFSPRTEGDVTYIPILVEELVIQKRLVAHEELVIRKTRVTEEQVVEEELRREVPVIRGPDGPVDVGAEGGRGKG
ncbi:MAG TPA: DUF2382 domain-containing protein [Longimicrobium sp.]|nr:DUF2382 domain-containing protein [Longimicrobium sp.]